MEDILDATLTGSDSTIDGVVQLTNIDNFGPAYEFTSIDNTLHLIIARDAEGKWMRVAGTEPYFSGWVDELAEQITFNKL
ncbi:MAG: hypothetical protein EOP46_12795 [Sphingobacteriaceae bacterium]|nr:MAG: hypothetical protein EOP46_12795 [Sphingobacteriaceae bacterium]